MTGPDPSRNDELLIARLVAGGSFGDAGNAAGVSVKTVQRRMGDPTFVARLRMERREVLRQTSDGLAAAAVDATTTLHQLVSDGEASAGVRVRAAKVLLDSAFRHAAMAELDVRLAALECQSTDAAT